MFVIKVSYSPVISRLICNSNNNRVINRDQTSDRYDEIELKPVHMLLLFQRCLTLDLSLSEKIAFPIELLYRCQLHNRIF